MTTLANGNVLSRMETSGEVWNKDEEYGLRRVAALSVGHWDKTMLGEKSQGIFLGRVGSDTTTLKLEYQDDPSGRSLAAYEERPYEQQRSLLKVIN